MARSTTELPDPLAQAARRFESWRRERTDRRIPEELWNLAVGLARHYGVSRVSQALRLQYYSLKERMESATEAPLGKASVPPAFVEILTAPSPAEQRTQVEFESPSGAKMRVEVNGTVSPGLVELSRLFLLNAR
jgi:hypothetical protein